MTALGILRNIALASVLFGLIRCSARVPEGPPPEYEPPRILPWDAGSPEQGVELPTAQPPPALDPTDAAPVDAGRRDITP